MSVRSECTQCQHYRPQASYVDLYKAFDRAQPRTPVMESLGEIRKEETGVLEQEVELLFELVRADEIRWPIRPRLAPFCAADAAPQVASLKNRARDCADFQPAFARAKPCSSCTYVREP